MSADRLLAAWLKVAEREDGPETITMPRSVLRELITELKTGVEARELLTAAKREWGKTIVELEDVLEQLAQARRELALRPLNNDDRRLS